MKKIILFFIISISILNRSLAASSEIILELEMKLERAKRIKDPEMLFVAATNLLKHQPYHPEGFLATALSLSQLGKNDDALMFFDLAIEYKCDQLYIAYMYKALCLETLGRLEEALSTYELSLNCPDMETLCSVYFGKDRILMKLGLLGPDGPKITELEWKFLEAKLARKWQNVITTSDELLKYRPDYPSIHFARAQALWQYERDSEAIVSYDLAIKYKYKPIGEIYYHKGLSLRRLGRLEEAQDALKKAFEYGSDHRLAPYAKIDVLQEMSELSKF